MVTIQIFKKSFGLVWMHRSLWLFGVLLALTLNSALWLGLAGNNEGVVENRIIITNEAIIRFPGQGLTIDFRQPGAPDVRIDGVEPGWYRNLTEELEHQRCMGAADLDRHPGVDRHIHDHSATLHFTSRPDPHGG